VLYFNSRVYLHILDCLQWFSALHVVSLNKDTACSTR